MSFFATCPKGLESLLSQELEELGATYVRLTAAGVYFQSDADADPLHDVRLAYRACLWSRTANRVLLPLNNGEVNSDYDLYAAAVEVPWEVHISPSATIAVDFTGTNKAINNTQFGAMRIKDAIVDRIRDKTGQRPSVDKTAAQLRINARLAKGKVYLSLDLSGESLHRRGYRTDQGMAPLKENLAAAVLLRAGWPAIAEQGGHLLDPMCGSGTLLIEAALLAAKIAPGLFRTKFGFEHWLLHQPAVWQELRAEAESQKQASLARGVPEMRGYDTDPRVLNSAQSNIERAGLAQWLRVSRKPVAELKKPTHTQWNAGLVICNPPYGERLGEVDALRDTYQTLGRVAKQEFPGWALAVFTGNSELGRELRLRPKRRYKFFNGTIPSELLLFDLVNAEEATLRVDISDQSDASQRDTVPQRPLSPGAQMIANRLKKNQKALSKWSTLAETNCYRLYDADMPEYAAAVDVYGDKVHVQEYAPPKTIDEAAAKRRLNELLDAICQVCRVPLADVAVKTRQRNKGKLQYEKLAARSDEAFFPVAEGRAKFWVNLWEYLDTGLFLDHRPLRRMIYSRAQGKRFLNLFCYTSTATVQAALGGATRTVSVDMSHTYLNWAERNFELNNVRLHTNELVQADCLEWLKACREGFDIIMLDPPTFSNSKRMDGVLDIQRDHVALVKRCMELLNPGGVLYFSTNLRTFSLDYDALTRYRIEDITAQTLDPDFARNKKIHHCFVITQ